MLPGDILESNAVGSLAFAVDRLLSLGNPLSSPLDVLSPGGIFSNDLSAITLSGDSRDSGGLRRD